MPLETSLVGSLLSNMHLMLGLGFIAGGIRHPEQTFNSTATKEVGTLLLLAVLSIVIPTLYHSFSGIEDGECVVFLSRDAAFVLIITYAFFLFFQIWSHRAVYEEGRLPSSDDPEGEEAVNRGARTPMPPSVVTIYVALTIATTLIGFHQPSRLITSPA